MCIYCHWTKNLQYMHITCIFEYIYMLHHIVLHYTSHTTYIIWTFLAILVISGPLRSCRGVVYAVALGLRLGQRPHRQQLHHHSRPWGSWSDSWENAQNQTQPMAAWVDLMRKMIHERGTVARENRNTSILRRFSIATSGICLDELQWPRVMASVDGNSGWGIVSKWLYLSLFNLSYLGSVTCYSLAWSMVERGNMVS